MQWNLRTNRLLSDVPPVPLTAELAGRLARAAARCGGHTAAPAATTEAVAAAAGVLCPWLPNTEAARQLLAAGFQVVALECGAAAVERACRELDLGPEETGVHDGWTRHKRVTQQSQPSAAAQPSLDQPAPAQPRDGCPAAGPQHPHQPPQLVYVYRGNPYNLTAPVLSLVPFPLDAVWDPWGLLVTPPQLLPRYAGVWAELLPRGGTWLAVAATVGRWTDQRLDEPGADGATAVVGDATRPALARLGLHAHPLERLLIPALERAGFAVRVLPLAPQQQGHGTKAGTAAAWGVSEESTRGRGKADGDISREGASAAGPHRLLADLLGGLLSGGAAAGGVNAMLGGRGAGLEAVGTDGWQLQVVVLEMEKVLA